MSLPPVSRQSRRPIIGCTSSRKKSNDTPPVEFKGLPTSYVEAVIAAGGIPLLIPEGLDEADLELVFDRIDGLLVPGGGDVDPSFYGEELRHETLRGINPGLDKLEFYMVRKAVAEQKPMLAICRGHQVFNVAMGGTLWQDVGSQTEGETEHDLFRKFPRHHIAHDVTITAGTNLARCLGTLTVSVNSLHHQGVRQLAPELTVAAVAPDGLVEGVEVPGHPFAVGVQWHPENLVHDHPPMMSLFKGFIDAAGKQA